MNNRARQFFTQALGDPGWLLYNVDLHADRAGFVRLRESEYREAAFLDQRLFSHPPRQMAMPLTDVQRGLEAHNPAPQPGHFLFHLGHCGSTLVSRLLGELPQIFALREPLPLLSLSAFYREQGTPMAWLGKEDYEALERLIFHFLTRSFHAQQVTLVKATSVCGNLAPRVLGHHPDNRIVLMYLTLDSYLTAMLRNEVRRRDINAVVQLHFKDLLKLTDLCGIQLYELDQAERTTITWLARMHDFISLQANDERRSLLLDFDTFLLGPRDGLRKTARHLGLTPDEAALSGLLDGAIMHRYTKDPTQRYGPDDRRRQLEAARSHYGPEIRHGLEWAGDLIEQIPGFAPLAPFLAR